MRSAHALPARDIEHVVVRSFPEAIAYPGCDHAGPYGTQLQAKMSIQFTVAAVLVHGRLDDEVFRAFAAEGEAAALARRVRLEHDDELARGYPQRQGAEVIVTLVTAAPSPGGSSRSSRSTRRACGGARARRSPACSERRAPRRSSARSTRSPARPMRRALRASSPATERPGVATKPTSRTIPRLLDELAARFAERDALVGPAERYTYRRSATRCGAFAKGCTRSASAKATRSRS